MACRIIVSECCVKRFPVHTPSFSTRSPWGFHWLVVRHGIAELQGILKRMFSMKEYPKFLLLKFCRFYPITSLCWDNLWYKVELIECHCTFVGTTKSINYIVARTDAFSNSWSELWVKFHSSAWHAHYLDMNNIRYSLQQGTSTVDKSHRNGNTAESKSCRRKHASCEQWFLNKSP